MNNSSNLPPSTCTCHLPNKVKKSIQWMLFDSGAKEISSGYFASTL